MLIIHTKMKQSFIKKTFVEKSEKRFDIIITTKKNRNKTITTKNYNKNDNITRAHIKTKIIKHIIINYSIR